MVEETTVEGQPAVAPQAPPQEGSREAPILPMGRADEAAATPEASAPPAAAPEPPAERPDAQTIAARVHAQKRHLAMVEAQLRTARENACKAEIEEVFQRHGCHLKIDIVKVAVATPQGMAFADQPRASVEVNPEAPQD